MSVKNIYILGNGYSINLLKLLKEEKIVPSETIERIDLNNLFSKGDQVPAPNGSIGYLSKKYCPILWGMGIRSTISTEQANEIINNIIMSHRIWLKFSRKHGITSINNQKNIGAYYELLDYLKRLFIYYNNLIKDDHLKDALNKVKIPVIEDILKLKDPSQCAIITYNYDIFLERMLKIKGVKFSVSGFENDEKNLVLHKPHGSISFDVKKEIPRGNIYNISCDDIKIVEIPTFDFSNSILIPPHGFIEGDSESWVKQLRNNVEKTIALLPNKIVFWGIAYNYVDREEFNDIIVDITAQTDIEYINPRPSVTLDYIFSSLFKNYIHKK